MIRKATNKDIPEVTKLVYSILREYGLKPDPSGTDVDLKDIEKNYPLNGGSFDVLLDVSGNIVGSVGVFKVSEEVCELRKMYLDPSQRGQGKGVVLLEHGLSRARDLGFSRVTLETAGVLKEAISLYMKYGFKEFKAEHVSSRCDQTFYLDL
ncbi:MAG: GNAT family N-acetyltransferase [Puniceicoccaceae bacterium]